ncbi:MAG: Protein of unknown function DUF424 [Candidatus Parvarchaeum acidophilus ARMAN-5]|jgi:hypothetical protein|uniref:DUF424 domain-containing protein n=1 Tax=Candidatus Parvarchaeum acidophilus ARMAN-5 TaxID=662762 RepID=D6GVP0_PARA5|nr:MAG: Protein of unknown function DUF424 [Candidatus Parvarchaeum acidophilus ARMAN-5]
MAFSMKIHNKGESNEIIAVCDSALLGKTLNDDEKEIEFLVSPDFYGNETLEWDEIKIALIRGSNINIIGNDVVELASKEGIINQNNTIDINGIKHAQVYVI